MKKTILSITIVAMVLALTVSGAEARFKNTINFEDNQFVDMNKLEILHRYQEISGAEPDTWDRTDFSYEVRYGVLYNFELGVNIPLKFYENGENGIGDLGIQQKFKFIDEKDNPLDMSGGIELILPTGDDKGNPPTGTDKVNARLFGSMGQSIDKRLKWIAGSGGTFYGQNDVENKFSYNAAVRWQADEKLRLNTELNGEVGGRPDNSELYASPGVIYRPQKGFSLTFSAPIGVTSDSSDHRLNFQMIHEF
ncbi:MAG: transporter [bacterium]